MAWEKCQRCGIVAPISCGEGSCATDVLCDYCQWNEELNQPFPAQQPPERDYRDDRHW